MKLPQKKNKKKTFRYFADINELWKFIKLKYYIFFGYARFITFKVKHMIQKDQNLNFIVVMGSWVLNLDTGTNLVRVQNKCCRILYL